eukprot:TRINITY_DN12618_c0_g1_i1.p1 TRINITY_DN12618_c0_g1~~TRINITY_DN12618_c0_g1_i1.p1  ORF type:complete len:471 (-),score=73.24 TRINITY_DN12618_c0_g1_i1:118-1530(-)
MGQSTSSVELGGEQERFFLQKVQLGQGAFGTVWRAIDKQTQSVVAVKQLDKASLPKRGVRRQDIEREVAILKLVSHENVTKLHATWEDDQSMYIALEFCDSGDLGDKLKERGMSLQESEAAQWMFQIISAIAALHSKCVCHRDIKPDNFMLSGDTVKLSDFGLAVQLQKGNLLTGKCGTPAFMSPELHQLPCSKGYGHSCDMWAAGVSMYMLMFGGTHPFLWNGQQINTISLLSGRLDFTVNQGSFFFGDTTSRYSEAARALCRYMVTPDATRRIPAEVALRSPWFNIVKADELAEDLAAEATSYDVLKSVEGTPVIATARAQSRDEIPLRWTPKCARDDCYSCSASEASSSQKLQLGLNPGTKCRYYSSTHQAWLPAVVHHQSLNGTIDLDIRQQASLQQISPAPHVNALEAWPPGTAVTYYSTTANCWIPAVVESFIPAACGYGSDGAYNLDVRACAESDKIRPRVAA